MNFPSGQDGGDVVCGSLGADAPLTVQRLRRLRSVDVAGRVGCVLLFQTS